MRAEQQRASEETRELRRELDLLRAPAAPVANGAPPAALESSAQPSPAQTSDPVPQAGPQEPSTASRLAKLEENQDVLEGKVNDQYQTKVESGSKYRVRLSGIALFNLYENRGTVENQDFPQLVESPASQAAICFSRLVRGISPAVPNPAAGVWSGHCRSKNERRRGFRFRGRISGSSQRGGDGPGEDAHRNDPAGLGQHVLHWRAGPPVFCAASAHIRGHARCARAFLCGKFVGLDSASARRTSLSRCPTLPLFRSRAAFSIHLPEMFRLTNMGEILPGARSRASQCMRRGLPGAIAAFGQNLTLGAGGYYGRQNWGFHRTLTGGAERWMPLSLSENNSSLPAHFTGPGERAALAAASARRRCSTDLLSIRLRHSGDWIRWVAGRS